MTEYKEIKIRQEIKRIFDESKSVSATANERQSYLTEALLYLISSYALDKNDDN